MIATVIRCRRAIGASLLLASMIAAAASPVAAAASPVATQQSKPAKPAGLSASSVSYDSVTLEWDDPDDDTVTGYRILRRDVHNQSSGVFTTVDQDTASTDTSYTDDTVEPRTKYAYRVVAINPAGTSSKSKYTNARTPAMPTPAKPAGLSASSVSYDSVTLEWDDPDDDTVTGYRILRRDVHNQPSGVFTTVDQDTASTDTSYTDDTVEPRTKYAYRVVAINPAGTSSKSKYTNARTPAAPTLNTGPGSRLIASTNETAQQEADPTHFVDIDAGWSHACALRANGQVVCWGINNNNNKNTPALSPPASNRYIEVSAGRFGSCGVLESGVPDCFDPLSDSSWYTTMLPSDSVTSISADSGPICWVLEDGSIGCTNGRLPSSVASEQFTSVHSGGVGYACGLTTSRHVKCWHLDGDLRAPTGRFKSIGYGGYNGCGIRDDDTVECWSHRSHYFSNPQLSFNDPNPTGTFTQVETSYHVSCGVRTDQSVECWGPPSGEAPNLSSGADFTPPEGQFTKVSVDFLYFACGLKVDRSVVCWGADETYEIAGIYDEPLP